jgi:hypothetical protein
VGVVGGQASIVGTVSLVGTGPGGEARQIHSVRKLVQSLQATFPPKRRTIMDNVLRGLIVLAALGFIMAVIGTVLSTSILGVPAEGFSRGSTNLSLLAIALAVIERRVLA